MVEPAFWQSNANPNELPYFTKQELRYGSSGQGKKSF
jgi:hypothetical protein